MDKIKQLRNAEKERIIRKTDGYLAANIDDIREIGFEKVAESGEYVLYTIELDRKQERVLPDGYYARILRNAWDVKITDAGRGLLRRVHHNRAFEILDEDVKDMLDTDDPLAIPKHD